jgi:hypothetical protein
MLKGMVNLAVFAAGLGFLGTFGSGCAEDAGEEIADAGTDHDASSAVANPVATNSTGNACPVVSSASVLPTVLRVGEVAQVTLVVSDPDDGPTPLSYSGSSAGGVLGYFTAVNTPTYQCQRTGTHSIVYKISDGLCEVEGTLSVTCTDPAAASERP